MLQVETHSSKTGSLSVHVGGPVHGATVVPSTLDEVSRATHAARQQAVIDQATSEGRQDAIEHAAKALEEAAVRLDKARELAEEALAADAVALAVEIARQLLKVKVEAGEYGLEEIVRSTLAASEIKRGECLVNVHPDDADRLADTVFRDGTRIVPHSGVEKGCVEIETPRGLLVRDLNACLSEIQEQLLEDLV